MSQRAQSSFCVFVIVPRSLIHQHLKTLGVANLEETQSRWSLLFHPTESEQRLDGVFFGEFSSTHLDELNYSEHTLNSPKQ